MTVNWRILLGGLVVAVPIIAMLAASFGRNPREVPAALVDRPAPEFALTTLDGDTVSLDDLVGRPAVVNFWSTWCQPCKIEHPVLVDAARRYDDVAFLGVLYSDDPVKARAYLRRAGTSYPHLVDPSGGMAIDYGVAGVPETYFIDAEGVITYKHSGPVSRELLASLLGAP